MASIRGPMIVRTPPHKDALLSRTPQSKTAKGRGPRPAHGCRRTRRALSLLRKDGPIGLDEFQTLIPFLGPQGLALVDRILDAARRLHKVTSETGGKVARLCTRSPGGGHFKDEIDLFRFMGITKSDARYALYFDLLFLVDCPQSELYQKGINLHALNWLTAAVGERLA
jgi:hypothetical protein